MKFTCREVLLFVCILVLLNSIRQFKCQTCSVHSETRHFCQHQRRGGLYVDFVPKHIDLEPRHWFGSTMCRDEALTLCLLCSPASELIVLGPGSPVLAQPGFVETPRPSRIWLTFEPWTMAQLSQAWLQLYDISCALCKLMLVVSGPRICPPGAQPSALRRLFDECLLRFTRPGPNHQTTVTFSAAPLQIRPAAELV